MNSGLDFDWDRDARTGLPEAIYCPGKLAADLEEILESAQDRNRAILLTRLERKQLESLQPTWRNLVEFDTISQTGFGLTGPLPEVVSTPIALVCAGTSDRPVFLEALRTLRFLGAQPVSFMDCGVAGLWRLQRHLPEIAAARVIIAVAGMEGALFSVLAGLTRALLIAVPTSGGYGVNRDGDNALRSALGACSPSVVAVNTDNGFGAACSAWRVVSGN